MRSFSARRCCRSLEGNRESSALQTDPGEEIEALEDVFEPVTYQYRDHVAKSDQVSRLQQGSNSTRGLASPSRCAPRALERVPDPVHSQRREERTRFRHLDGSLADASGRCRRRRTGSTQASMRENLSCQYERSLSSMTRATSTASSRIQHALLEISPLDPGAERRPEFRLERSDGKSLSVAGPVERVVGKFSGKPRGCLARGEHHHRKDAVVHRKVDVAAGRLRRCVPPAPREPPPPRRDRRRRSPRPGSRAGARAPSSAPADAR